MLTLVSWLCARVSNYIRPLQISPVVAAGELRCHFFLAGQRCAMPDMFQPGTSCTLVCEVAWRTDMGSNVDLLMLTLLNCSACTGAVQQVWFLMLLLSC